VKCVFAAYIYEVHFSAWSLQNILPNVEFDLHIHRTIRIHSCHTISKFYQNPYNEVDCCDSLITGEQFELLKQQHGKENRKERHVTVLRNVGINYTVSLPRKATNNIFTS
jgi:hypothetical protein